MYDIAVLTTEDKTLRIYKASEIPHKGDLLYFPHLGCFEVLDTIFNVSDDRDSGEDEIMFVQVIIDADNPITLKDRYHKYVPEDIPQRSCGREYRVTTSYPGGRVNVRSSPTLESEVLYTLGNGDSVYTWEVQDGWGKIRDGAWVLMQYLELGHPMIRNVTT